MGKRQTYTRAGLVAIADVLPVIAVGIRKKAEFCGHVVNVTSLRLQTFVKSTVCSAVDLLQRILRWSIMMDTTGILTSGLIARMRVKVKCCSLMTTH